MEFRILDTESTYRRLLDAPDAAAREAIFSAELIAPFQGLVNIFGGDGLAAFKSWNMSPEHFTGEMGVKIAQWLDTLAAANAWKRAAAALETGWAAFAPLHDRVKLDEIVFGLMLADLTTVPWARNYTGFGGIAGWIMTVYGEPDAYNLQRIEACTVHELHHNIMAAVGLGMGGNPDIMNITVGEYMIGEGLAESFAAELYGEENIGPWVTDLNAEQLAEARRVIGGALEVKGFNQVRAYIFGDLISEGMGRPTTSVPTLAGYSIGYRVVQQYMQRTGKRVVETSLIPAREIIAESGFFA